MGTFEGLLKIERDEILDFADFFCENFILNSGGIWHENIAWAKRHIHVLRLLGIPMSHVRLLDMETGEETAGESRNRRKDWENNLEINRPTWLIAEKRISMKRTSCSIGIRVLSKAGGKVSYAFRYIHVSYSYRVLGVSVFLGTSL
jgi:hypothetical protein